MLTSWGKKASILHRKVKGSNERQMVPQIPI